MVLPFALQGIYKGDAAVTEWSAMLLGHTIRDSLELTLCLLALR